MPATGSPATARARFKSTRRVPKTSDYVARELADEIISSDLPIGTMLPPEHEMVEALGVGRGTLREALRLLEARGVIRIKVGPGGGPVVRRPSAADLADGLTMILHFESASLEDVVQARVALESTVVRAAASAPSAELVARLTALNHELKGQLDDVEGFGATYRLLHSTLVHGVGGAPLELFVQSLMCIFDSQSETRGLRVPPDPDVRRSIVRGHARLLRLIADGDAVEAERAIQRQLAAYYQPLRAAFPADFERPLRWTL